MRLELRRIFNEKRALVLPLSVALLANVAFYLLAVYPLSLQVGAADRRAQSARVELQMAQEDQRAARRLLEGKDRAGRELQKFYEDLLPADIAGARRITYVRLMRLARTANLRPAHRNFQTEPGKEGRLGRLRMQMLLEGEYDSVRQFIYSVETSPEFVVIDDVALTQGSEPNSPLVLTLELSTYFRHAGSNGN